MLHLMLLKTIEILKIIKVGYAQRQWHPYAKRHVKVYGKLKGIESTKKLENDLFSETFSEELHIKR